MSVSSQKTAPKKSWKKPGVKKFRVRDVTKGGNPSAVSDAGNNSMS